MNEESNRPWLEHEDDLLFVNGAADRELDDYSRREAAMQSRGTILVGAASLVGAIQLSNDLQPASILHTVLSVGHLGLSFIAAVAGVVVLFPRTGDGFNARTLRDKLLKGMSKEEATHHMVRVKLDNLDADEKSLTRRGAAAKLGFIALAAGVLLAAVGAVVPSVTTSPPSPTPTGMVSNVP